jgi:hypothetical protein
VLILENKIANMFLHIFVLAASAEEAEIYEHPHDERQLLHVPSLVGRRDSNLCGSNLGSFDDQTLNVMAEFKDPNVIRHCDL